MNNNDLERGIEEVIRKRRHTWKHSLSEISRKGMSYESYLASGIASKLTVDEGQWIKCEDKHPMSNIKVIAYTKKDGVLWGMYLDRTKPIGEWVSKYLKWSGDTVTHWMPLPESPKASSNIIKMGE